MNNKQSRKRHDASEAYQQQSKERRGPEIEEVREGVSDQMEDNEAAADIAIAAVDELADQATELDELNRQLSEAKDQLLRKAAEFQNYRRRVDEEKAMLVEIGKSAVIQKFLDVLDDFDRSREAAEQVEQQDGDTAGPAYYALKEGIELVYRKFKDELQRQGVEPIEAVGQPFDENLHDAMMQQEVEDTAPGIVVQELQKGYRKGDRVLRHSKVIVSS